MSLSQRFSLWLSCLFSLVLAIIILVIYYLLADLRQGEFINHLTEKAEIAVQLFTEPGKADYDFLKLIDKNSISRIDHEKVEVFDASRKKIYDSNNATSMIWSKVDLDKLELNKRLFKKYNQYNNLGIYHPIQGKNYYVLISAEDVYGNQKLIKLRYFLFSMFAISTGIIWLLSYTISKKSLKPLNVFRKQIQEISSNGLLVKLIPIKYEDEIAALISSFNQMMERLDSTYIYQKEFINNVSHELRTPLARIAAQLENLLQIYGLDTRIKHKVTDITNDLFQLSEVISSLITLSEINNYQAKISFKRIRLDELIFSSASELALIYPDFNFRFEIENSSGQDTEITVLGNEMLLKIVLLNLLKNAIIYSDDHSVECLLLQQKATLSIVITNSGEVPKLKDPAILFSSFYRGSNIRNTPGSGMGLAIAKRVLQYHEATITYQAPHYNFNQFTVTFPQQFEVHSY